MDPALSDTAAILKEGGLLGIILFLVYGGMTGLYVWKREYEEMRKRAEREQDRAEHAVDRALNQIEESIRIGRSMRQRGRDESLDET